MTPGTIGVVGGGTAGLFASLFFQRRYPGARITRIDSSAIPIIGVGEATTTLMPRFLHHTLGLDIVALFNEVAPTFKLGIGFEWGAPGDDFAYPFGPANPVEAMAWDGSLADQSLNTTLIGLRNAPVIRDADGSIRSLLHEVKWAWHLDNAPFVAFLTRAADARGIEHLDARIEHVETRDGEVTELRFADGHTRSFEFYVDASGFRSVLLDEALRSPFQSWGSSLFCDSALVCASPHQGPLRPFTQASTMRAGWAWRIPVQHEEHHGYVFSSAFLEVDRAADELRALSPATPRLIRFRSGRHAECWKGNVLALGNAYAFVEPLESTALHMVILELEAFAEATDAATFNARIAAHWDSLRWFLAAHYRFNQRLETPFWKAARAGADVSGLTRQLARLREEGPWVLDAGRRFEVDDPTFGHAGLMTLLLGQRVEAAPPRTLELTRAQWRERTSMQRELAGRALPHREALEWLARHPDVLRAAVEDPRSWIARGDA